MAESQSNYVEPSPKPNAALADKGDGGYDKALHNRHMQMISVPACSWGPVAAWRKVARA